MDMVKIFRVRRDYKQGNTGCNTGKGNKNQNMHVGEYVSTGACVCLYVHLYEVIKNFNKDEN